jgi:phosphoribosylformylglycinamidine (FGAM) synthase-like amidotransferase family enzyme
MVYAPGAALGGDVLVVRAGLAGPPTPEALEALRAYALGGGRVLGLADGVAWLCAAALLPGRVRVDSATGPVSASPSHVRVEGRATPFTWAIPAGRIVALAPQAPTARYTAPDAEIAALATRGQIVLRYCDASGGVSAARTGDHAASVAGVSDESGYVVGVLAPSTAGFDTDLGRQLLTCLQRR